MKLQIYFALRRRIRAIILCGIICIYSLISSACEKANAAEPANCGTEKDNVTVVSTICEK